MGNLFKDEPNARIHLVAAIAAVSISVWFDLNANEWIWIILAICLVIVAEIINSAIENLSDAISLEVNENIRKAKDLGAAATLLTALFAVIVALIIFLPKLI